MVRMIGVLTVGQVDVQRTMAGAVIETGRMVLVEIYLLELKVVQRLSLRMGELEPISVFGYIMNFSC